jgi:hypothetical protein
VVAFLVVHATFFFPGDLMMYVKCAHMVNADHDPDYKVLLAGELGGHFPFYFLIAYLLKEPLAAIVLAAIGLVALVRSRSIPRLGKLFLTLPPVVFFIVISALADDFGNRYIIPVLPFLHLAGGLGVLTLLRLAPRFKWAPWAAVALCAWALAAAIGIYPDHLSYFNEAACFDHPDRIGLDGGSRCGTEWLDNSNVDWGQSLKQLKMWLDRNAPGRQVSLASPWQFPAEAYGINYRRVEMAELSQDPVPGLYAVSGHLVARIPSFGGSNWLRRMRPVAIVGHAIYIYDVPAS